MSDIDEIARASRVSTVPEINVGEYAQDHYRRRFTRADSVTRVASPSA
jgi:hypothetical protein